MQSFEPNSVRFQLALEQLRVGISIDFGEINFWLSPEDSILEVRMRSNWNIENVTNETAFSDFEEARRMVAYLEAKDSDFANLLRSHPLRYILINDYGTGIVEICRFMGDKIIWAKK